jgi:hypothetical protein
MRNKELQAITASIYYLASEAEKADLPNVSTMLWNVIGEIDAFLKDPQAAQEDEPLEVVDSDLLSILHLLQKLPAENKLALAEILDVLDHWEEAPGKVH